MSRFPPQWIPCHGFPLTVAIKYLRLFVCDKRLPAIFYRMYPFAGNWPFPSGPCNANCVKSVSILQLASLARTDVVGRPTKLPLPKSS